MCASSQAFDELLLLKGGAQLIYCGPLGAQSGTMISYFGSIPGMPPCPLSLNPATWLLDVTSTVSESRLGVDLAEVYRDSRLAK